MFGRSPSLGLLWLAAASSVVACRASRSLDELEDVLAPAPGREGAPLPAVGEGAAATGSPAYGRLERLFVPAGAVAVLGPRRVQISPAAGVAERIELVEGACYVAIAHADGDADIDMALDDPAGVQLAVDRATDAFPVLASVCPPTSGTHGLRIWSNGAPAPAWVGVYALPEARAANAARLAAEVARRAPGARALGPPAAEWLERGADHIVPLALAPGECVLVVAHGLIDLDLVITDARDTPVARDLGTDDTPVIERFCPPLGGAYSLHLKAYQGAGEVAWQLWAAPPARTDGPGGGVAR